MFPFLRHPVRGDEQHCAGLEGTQQRQCDRPEALARVVEGQQYGPVHAVPVIARCQIFLQRQSAIPVAAQEFQIAREHLRFHVVIREHRNLAARERQAEDEAGVPRARDACGSAQQPTDVVHEPRSFYV
jgi:hypothetical protein